MAVTVRRLRRIEAWSNWKAAGGTRQIVVEAILAAHVIIKLDGQERLEIALPLDSPALPFLQSRSVIRVDQDDATYDEWKIVDRALDDQSGMARVTAAPFRSTDLSGAALISRADSDGVRVYDFESLGFSPADHITNWILPALAAAGLGWVSIGTMVPTAVVDLTFQWDNPLAALMRLATATQTELDIRRNADVGYYIDLVTKVNSGAQTADLRVEKNLINVERDESSLEMATRVFPRGADTDGLHATMARARWQVTNVAGAVITLADPAGGKGPIQFDGQLVGRYLLKTNGALSQVTASSAGAQTVTLASGAAVANGDMIGFRVDGAGNDLTYLEDPVAVVTYGIKAAVKDVPDVPVTNNLVKNSVMRSWPGSAVVPPPNWAVVGGPAILKQTAAPYTALGGASIRVTSTADADGVVSDAQPITPTATNPYVSAYAKIWVASGSARVELILTIPSGTKVVPLFPAVASNSVLGQWVDLGVSGIDANAVGATAAAIRIVQNGVGSAVFYVDAGQITMSAAQLPFFEGSGGTRLWQEANEALRTGSNPLASYTVPLVDLEACDPVTWSDSALIIGANARIIDPRLLIEVTTRIIELDRDYFVPGNSSIILSNRFDDLTDILAEQSRATRAPNDVGDSDVPGLPSLVYPALTGVNLTVKEDGSVVAVLAGNANTTSYKYLASKVSMPADATVESTGTVASGQQVTITGLGGLTLALGERAYIRAIPYTDSPVFVRGVSGTGQIDRQNKTGTKILRLSALMGIPDSPTSTDPHILSFGAFHGGANAVNWHIPIILPIGATITAWRVRVFTNPNVNGSWSLCQCTFESCDDQENFGTLSTLTAPATSPVGGWQTLSGSLSEVVGSSSFNNYKITAVLGKLGGGGSTFDAAKFLWAEFDYTAPDLFTSY